MRARSLGLLLAAALTLAGSTARAQDAVGQAKLLFNAGAQAYSKGDFRGAIQAFEAAHKLAPRPAILFSLAQAYRRQFSIEPKPADLRLAITHFRQYVAEVPQGGRRADAASALAELQPMADRLSPDEGGAAAQPQTPAKIPPRVTVTTPTKNARVFLDGKPDELPLIAEVPPGKHTVKLTADGFFDEEREVQAVEGGVFPLDIPLRERPAKLTIQAPSGAQITIDGRPVGVAPLAGPLEVASGKHLIAVTSDGHLPMAKDVELARGGSATITADLATTKQRVVSYVFLGAGAGAIAVGVVTSAIAVYYQSEATKIQAEAQAGNIELERVAQYDVARDQRDNWRRVAYSGYIGGAVLGATGLALYLFDKPSIEAPAARRDDQPQTTGPAAPTEIEVSAVPLIGPDMMGGSVVGRF